MMISEKMIVLFLPSKLLISCLLAFSILLLISSSLSILHFNHFFPTSLPSFSTPQAQPNPQHNSHPNTTNTTSTHECNNNRALLRVYMYDLPPEFHFGMLGNSNRTWPNLTDPNGRLPSYPGGLNLQHSAEYWLTLDLLSSNNGPCTAIRVVDPTQADLIFVPFFSSLSYNRHSKERDRSLQGKLVKFLTGRSEWKRSGGRDHLIPAHHPNSMLFARKKLGSSTFLLSDFGRYSPRVANLKKDVIAPYKHMVRSVSPDNSPPFEERTTLAYFQGAIYRKDGGAIRQELYRRLKGERDVHFAFGSARSSSVREAGRGMSLSKFCLSIAGDTPSSNRLFDSIAALCVPVVISDAIELPFEDVLDYSRFCVFVRASDAVKRGYLMRLLRGISREKWTEMWERLKGVSRHFEYQYPSRPDDAVDMIWQTVVSTVRIGTTGGRILGKRNRFELVYLLGIDLMINEVANPFTENHDLQMALLSGIELGSPA